MKETDGYTKALQHHAAEGCKWCAAQLLRIDVLTQHMRALPEGVPIVISVVEEVGKKGGKKYHVNKVGSGRTHTKHRTLDRERV